MLHGPAFVAGNERFQPDCSAGVNIQLHLLFSKSIFVYFKVQLRSGCSSTTFCMVKPFNPHINIQNNLIVLVIFWLGKFRHFIFGDYGLYSYELLDIVRRNELLSTTTA